MEHPRSMSTVDERLDGALLKDLRDDLHLLTRDNGVILFAVDAFDVLRYCFPTGASATTIRIGDLEKHADYFAALSFVMRQNHWKPILLPEYLAEVYGFSAGLVAEYGKRQIGDLHIQQAIRREVEALLPAIPESPGTTEAVEFMKEYFPLVLLLAAAGTAHIGLRELGSLVQGRLISLGTLPEEPSQTSDVWSVLAEFSRRYRPNPRFVDRCYTAFQRIYTNEAGETRKRNSPANDRADAVAVDQVLQMNQLLREAHRDGRIDRPHTVRLLSSSARLRMLVDAISHEPELAEPSYALPHLRIVRVPDQIFAFVIAHPSPGIRSPEDMMHTEEVLETIKWLVELHERADSLRDDTRFTVRVRNEMKHGLDLLETHRRRVLTPYQNSYENLALFSRMRQPLSEVLGFATKVRKVETGDVPLVFRIRDLVNSENLDSAAREALNAQRQLVRVHTILAHRWCIGLSKGSTMDVSSTATDDFVHGAYHALPWLIHVSESNLELVVVKTREAFFSHPDDVQLRREALAEAFEQLVKYDTTADAGRAESAEADLVRAVAFLALRDRSSEKAAATLARTIRDSGPYKFTLDALYVEIWAERRMSHFDQAIELAASGIAQAPDDPRFWHGRALARFGKVATKTGTPFDYTGVRTDLEVALRLYRATTTQTPDLQSAMVVGCLNALTYIHALTARAQASPTVRDRHLECARTYLDELKTLLVPEEWAPRYPEFFHTEGFLERQESERLPAHERKMKLEEALKAAARAKQLAPTRPGHADLLDEITELLRATGRGDRPSN